ncbi:MAG: alanine racemase [Actinomycetota bacterium]|nr:alanine racemase [Actinomycetota bacterium]
MAVRLTVPRAEWLAHVRATADHYSDGVVPVVKGNGYGFGRPLLHGIVHELGLPSGRPEVCVGTVHELHDVPAALAPIVLTPTLVPPAGDQPVLTVGSLDHVRALHGWHGRVLVKLASSMRRYGASPQELAALVQAVQVAGLQVHGYAIHLPLTGNDADRLAEIEAWLPHVPFGATLWVSHLTPASYLSLRADHPSHHFRVRVGTALWHGVPRHEFLRLSATVLQRHEVRAGDEVGYHGSVVPFDGTLVAIGAGSAHGVAPLDEPDPTRRSPFHFARRRLTLLERPHMHSSLALVAPHQPCPQVGDRVDVQRPLIVTTVDEVEWLP